jgi:hypothetical protein
MGPGLLRAKVIGSIVLMALSAVSLQQVARAQCGASGSDDFNDNTVDAAKWGADIYYLPSRSQLSETNGRLEYTAPGVLASSVAYRPWELTYGSYLSDWETQVDVHMGGIVLTKNHSHVEFDLAVANEATVTNLSNVTLFYIALDLFRDSSGQITRSLEIIQMTNGVEMPIASRFPTSSQSVSLRLTFDGQTKTLTAWYDEDGPINGYQWTALQTNRIDAAGVPWNLDATSRFQILLGGSSDGIAVSSTDLVFADKFSMTSAPCYSRFVQFERKPDGGFGLVLEGNGRSFDLERSETLAANAAHWQTITTLTNGVSGMPEYVDALGTNGRPRFYRAVLKQP